MVLRQCGICELAAAHAFAIARNHPSVGGNKRPLLLALHAIVGLSGIDFDGPEADAAAIIRRSPPASLVRGLTRWIGDNFPK
jgi:death on curing protein